MHIEHVGLSIEPIVCGGKYDIAEHKNKDYLIRVLFFVDTTDEGNTAMAIETPIDIDHFVQMSDKELTRNLIALVETMLKKSPAEQSLH